jgi:ATP-dependent Clp protease ATP-binding subunit ClpA
MITESVNEILDSAATYACHSGLACVDVSLVALATMQTHEVKDFLKENRIDEVAISAELFSLFDKLKKSDLSSMATPFRMSPETIFVYKIGEGVAKRLQVSFSPLHLLLGLTDGRPGDGHYLITQIMEKHGLFADNLFEHISYTSFLKTTEKEIKGEPVAPAKDIDAEIKEKLAQIRADDVLSESPILQQFCENLMVKARNGLTDPVIGREQEITRAIRILSRRKKNNPILIGEPGVGKTSIAEELARLIAIGAVSNKLKNKHVISLDLGALVGGAKFKGELEDRLKKLLAEVKALGNIILFIDEIHMLPGRLLDGCGDLLKPALANGELTAIGATTHSEYLMHFEKDAAMARRFQPVMVNEPDRDTAVEIVKGLLPHYERYHDVVFDEGMAEYAVDMAVKYIPRQSLPDKAIDLIDEAAAVAVEKNTTEVSKECIDTIIHDLAGAGATSFDPQGIMEKLRSLVIGQEAALKTTEQFLNTVDLKIVNGEIKGTISLSSAIGVDKTQFIRSLATATGCHLMELDGNALQHESAIWRLLGSMPGYRDHEKGGQLTEALRRNPRTMLTFRNFDNAHPDVKEMMIDLLKKGVIFDSANKPVAGGETYVIFINDMEIDSGIGFLSKGTNHSLEPSFSSELKELIDADIILEQPNRNDLSATLELMTQALQTKMKKAGRCFDVSSNLVTSILDKALQSDNRLERLNKEFATRIKGQLISTTIPNGEIVLLDLETVQ